MEDLPVRMPGFTAEASLYSAKDVYRAENYFASLTESGKALPQGCYLIPYGDQWIQNCCYYDPVTGIHGCHAFKPHFVPLTG